MTSQLNVDTIVDKAGSGGTNVKIGNISTYVSDGGAVTQNTVQGLNKVWLQYDQGTTAIQDSFNVASIADNATGKATTTYTNPMSSTSYAIGGCCQGNGFITIPSGGPDTDNTGALVTVSNGGSDTDYNHVGPSIKGDLA